MTTSRKCLEVDMDLRDYFALKAMPLAMQMEKENTDKQMGNKWYWDGVDDVDVIASLAYAVADAMMKAREEGEPEP
jgi:hypothetical protein